MTRVLRSDRPPYVDIMDDYLTVLLEKSAFTIEDVPVDRLSREVCVRSCSCAGGSDLL